jgi:hypothetical protein
VYYDGKKTPSVDVPLGDFFGVGHGYERNLESMVIRDSSFGRARNSYWPMPFRVSCKITVTDEGDRPMTMFYYHVDWQRHKSLPDDVAYLHAYYRQERPAVKGRNYEFLNIRGAGHYVGTVLNVIQAGVGWFGEGDDLSARERKTMSTRLGGCASAADSGAARRWRKANSWAPA